jgi:hypothetical protein
VRLNITHSRHRTPQRPLGLSPSPAAHVCAPVIRSCVCLLGRRPAAGAGAVRAQSLAPRSHRRRPAGRLPAAHPHTRLTITRGTARRCAPSRRHDSKHSRERAPKAADIAPIIPAGEAEKKGFWREGGHQQPLGLGKGRGSNPDLGHRGCLHRRRCRTTTSTRPRRARRGSRRGG